MRADVVIVGAGIMGSSTAYHIVRSSDLRVVVVDRGGLGGLATSKSAGHVRQHYNHPLLVQLAMRGREKLENFSAEVGEEINYVPCGFMILVDELDLPELQANVRMQREVGLDVSVLTPSAARERFPYLLTGKVAGGAYEPRAGYADPYSVASAYATAARKLGAVLQLNTEVTGIGTEGGQVKRVYTSRGELVTDLIIDAAGARGGQVARLVGWDIPVWPRQVRKLVTVKPRRPFLRTHPVVDCVSEHFYFRSETGGHALIGARVPIPEGVAIDDIDMSVDLDYIVWLLERFAAFVEDGDEATLQSCWAGVDGDTPDFQPIIGEPDHVKGFFAVTGFTGHGFKLGPAIGEGLAHYITTGAYSTIDLTPFDARRFEQGNIFKGVYRKPGA